MLIKVCGLNPVRDVQLCLDLKVNFLGFIFYKKSPRNINLKEIKKLSNFNKKNSSFVAVTVDPTDKFIKDMAAGVSAAKGIRRYMNKATGKVTVYMTGNIFPKDVEEFKVSAFGFEDYNSSDIIVSTDKKKFFGVSLKKKKDVKASDPTLINKAFSSVFEGKKYDKLKQEMVDLRIKYFSGLIKKYRLKERILLKLLKNPTSIMTNTLTKHCV